MSLSKANLSLRPWQPLSPPLPTCKSDSSELGRPLGFQGPHCHNHDDHDDGCDDDHRGTDYVYDLEIVIGKSLVFQELQRFSARKFLFSSSAPKQPIVVWLLLIEFNLKKDQYT